MNHSVHCTWFVAESLKLVYLAYWWADVLLLWTVYIRIYM